MAIVAGAPHPDERGVLRLGAVETGDGAREPTRNLIIPRKHAGGVASRSCACCGRAARSTSTRRASAIPMNASGLLARWQRDIGDALR